MRLAGMAAADEGVHALDAVDQAVLDQEVERAIDGGRRRAEVLVAQLVEQRIGADRLVARPDELEHAAAQRREAQVLVRAQLLGRREGILDAVLVVVAVRGGFGRLLHEMSRFAKQNRRLYAPFLPEAKAAHVHRSSHSPIRQPRSTRARGHPVRRPGPGARDRPAARHRRGADDGLDGPRRRGRDHAHGPRLLLVALAQGAVAQGRHVGPHPDPGRAARSIATATRCWSWSSRPASPATPDGTTASSARSAAASSRPSRRSIDRHGQDREGLRFDPAAYLRGARFSAPPSLLPARRLLDVGPVRTEHAQLHSVAARRPAGALDPEQRQRQHDGARRAGADGHHQRGPRHPGAPARRGGRDGRYVVSLVNIRKIHEFIFHRRQGDVLILHHSDTKFARLASVRYPRNGKPSVITDTAFAEADFQQQLAFWFERMPGR